MVEMAIGIKRTKEEIEKIVNDKGYILLNEYYDSKNNSKRVTIEDSLGYKYDCVFSSIIIGYKIRIVHPSNPFSLENISLWLKLNNKDFYLTDNNFYMGSKSPLEFLCPIYKEIFYMPWGSIYNSGCGCSVCSGRVVSDKNRLSTLYSSIAKEWHPALNGDKKPQDFSHGSHIRVWWKCSKCGYEWKTDIKHRKEGRGCPACSLQVVTDRNRLSITNPELITEWHPTKNGSLSVYDVSHGSTKKVWWKCSECGREWKAVIYSRSIGNGCSRCTKSRGEKRISKFLEDKNIFYISDYRFDDCKNIKRLPFDFYFPNNNLIIEYQGLQHYAPVDFAGKGNLWAEENSNYTQKNDIIKKEYCKENNIELLEISYKDFDNIENILSKILYKEQCDYKRTVEIGIGVGKRLARWLF
jgi:hypothetical protein